jgi:hypothetical protein
MLTVITLRRIGADAARAADAAWASDAAAIEAGGQDAWTRLRLRIERSSQRAREQAWRWRMTLSGLATASLLVAAFVGPATIQIKAGSETGDPAAYGGIGLDRLDWSMEFSYVEAARRSSIYSTSADASALGSGVIGPTMYPDGIRPERKEVQPAPATTRLPEAS